MEQCCVGLRWDGASSGELGELVVGKEGGGALGSLQPPQGSDAAPAHRLPPFSILKDKATA